MIWRHINKNGTDTDTERLMKTWCLRPKLSLVLQKTKCLCPKLYLEDTRLSNTKNVVAFIGSDETSYPACLWFVFLQVPRDFNIIIIVIVVIITYMLMPQINNFHFSLQIYCNYLSDLIVAPSAETELQSQQIVIMSLTPVTLTAETKIR